MFIALTGTPGTGKTSVSKILNKCSYDLIDLNKLAIENNFIIGIDNKRDTQIVDTNKINNYIKSNYSSDRIVIIDSHFSHLLDLIDKVIILRCHPKELKQRLVNKKWSGNKIKENLESEALDIILCESSQIYKEKNIFEIDTTNKNINEVADVVRDIIDSKFKPLELYRIGQIDWSEEVFSI